MDILTMEEKIKLSHIIFSNNNQPPTLQILRQLSNDERKKLKQLYIQKIAYQTVNQHIYPLPQHPPPQTKFRTTPGFISSICCCFFPQDNRQNFDITTSLFLRKICGVLMFWSDRFLQLSEGNIEMYGPLWLILAYVIILGVASNLNEYFIKPENYKFNNDIVFQGLGINLIFRIAQPLIYSAIMKCLGSFMPSSQSIMLTGYSIVLYYLPTIFCLIPSLYWHIIMMAVGSILRGMFLSRNYVKKLDSKVYVMLIVISLIEFFYSYILLETLFRNNGGYSIEEGAEKVLGGYVTLRSYRDEGGYLIDNQ